MKKIIIASVVALAFVAVTATASAAFNTNLSVGSTGADVSALQTWLMNKGFSIPSIASGAAQKGYFGQQTKLAVIAYQKSVNLPTTGFVGPMTRGVLNGSPVVTTTPGTVTCPAGYTCTANPGTTITTGIPGSITTPGMEGTLSVTQGAIPNTTLYVGDQKVPIMSLAIQAQTSDISVQRVMVDLGSDSTIYTKQLSTLYVMDGSNVLASMPLNVNTVTKSSNEYYATITGFNFIVPKNSPNRYLTIAADVWPSVDSSYRYPTKTTIVSIPVNGVRGVDGAGINENSPALSGFSQTTFINASLTDSADIKLSTDGSNPASGAIIASSGANNDQADKITSLVFDIKAEKDNVGITQVVATTTIGGSANNSSTTAAYLFDGSTLIASAAINSSGVATFSNINGSTGYIVPANTTKAFTIKVDIRQAGSVPANLSTTITSAGITAQNSQGSNLTSSQITGSAVTPNAIAIQKAGPVFTLVGTPTISKSVIGQTASSTFATGFTFDLSAQGTSVSIAASGAFVIGIYVDGSQVATTSATYEKPVSGVTGSGPYVIADGSTARFTARTSFVGPQSPYLPAGHIVTARLESVNGSNTYISDTFRATSDGSGNAVTL